MADQLTRTLRRGNRRAEGTTKLTGPDLMECVHIFSVLKHEQDVGERLVSAVTMTSLKPYGCLMAVWHRPLWDEQDNADISTSSHYASFPFSGPDQDAHSVE